MKTRKYPLQPSNVADLERYVVGLRLCGLRPTEVANIADIDQERVDAILGKYGHARDDGRYQICPAVAQLMNLPVEYVPLVSLKPKRDGKAPSSDLRMCVTGDMPDGVYAQKGWPPFHRWDDERR